MDNDIKHVHVGQAIDKRRNELGLSKSELGRKIGVPQQHINRILERETIKLLKEQIESLNSQILRLDSNLKDKDVIIELLKDRK